MKVKHVLFLACFVFISLNLFLVLIDDTNVQRVQIVNHLDTPVEDELIQTLTKPGVLASLNEEHIHFNPNIGAMGDLYVQEGQEVEAGDILFTYVNVEIESKRQELQQKIAQLDLRMTQLSEEISRVTFNKNELTTYYDPFDEYTTQNDLLIAQNQQIANEYEIQILQKLHQIEELQLEKEKVNHTLISLDERLGELQVTSPITGIIKEVNPNRDHPLVTITSHAFVAMGELTEKEIVGTAEGMDVQITPQEREAFSGVLSRISRLPTQEVSLAEAATYPFYVDIDLEDQGGLRVGYQVDLDIIQKEISNAVIVHPDSIIAHDEEYSVLVAEEGKLQLKDVSLGLLLDEKQEITAGLSDSDYIVIDPTRVLVNHPFVTMLDLEKIEETTYLTFRKKDLLTFLAQGYVH